MKSKILIFILLCTMSCQDKDQHKKLIGEFAASLSNDNMPTREIISKYMKLNEMPLDKKKLVDSILSLQVNALRDFAGSCQKPYEIYTYEEARHKNLSGFFEIQSDDLKNVYFLECKSDELLPFKISEDHKIISFSTMSKGNMRYFLKYYED